MPEVIHEVRLYVTKDCNDTTMTATQLGRWVGKQFEGCEYGDVFVREVTTKVDGVETDNKTFTRK